MTHWIMIVDDDTTTLKTAGLILSKAQMRVTALASGKGMLDYIRENQAPDLILLDIKMPDLDGFETLRRLRELEKEEGLERIPVIFLTADENAETETHSFAAGVSDYIRKPFRPEVLLSRINNILVRQETMRSLRSDASTDKLTGFLNKTAAAEELRRVCGVQTGCLMMIDLDSFKLVNDIYGHDMGDRVLRSFAEIISSNIPDGSRCGRIGGDEFAIFCQGMTEENAVARLTERLNTELLDRAKQMMGSDMVIPLGASVGAVFAPLQGTEYASLIKLADQALYTVKQNGKHGYAFHRQELSAEEEMQSSELDIHALSAILGERVIPNVALELDKDAFSYVYRYVMRYIIRNQRTACKALLTLAPGSELGDADFKALCTEFGAHIRSSLRKSDFLTRARYNQYFIFLTDIQESYIDKVLGNNIIRSWRSRHGDELVVACETEFVGADIQDATAASKIVVVDDDSATLNMAGHILSKGGLYVTALRSGQALLNYVQDNIPDLILLDIKMPDMDGFETLQRLRCMESGISDIPVVFLTADESKGNESRGLQLGAMDYIVKPFVPDVLLLRVRHILELVNLQRRLSFEVDRKTRENQSLLIDVVKSLADAIDAKDTCTNGHSDRVAEYAREIARRTGYSVKAQEDIYIMGLLHDVGKIGVPDAVINKPCELSEEEFEIIRNHPVMGARILRNIKEMPKLATGARWHHERYDGSGYPDGLKGNSIPEEARIIAVADAYDAMTSCRSYRRPLSQAAARKELEEKRGTQFDPHFADIMLGMIDEDKDFTMRE